MKFISTIFQYVFAAVATFAIFAWIITGAKRLVTGGSGGKWYDGGLGCAGCIGALLFLPVYFIAGIFKAATKYK